MCMPPCLALMWVPGVRTQFLMLVHWVLTFTPAASLPPPPPPSFGAVSDQLLYGALPRGLHQQGVNKSSFGNQRLQQQSCTAHFPRVGGLCASVHTERILGQAGAVIPQHTFQMQLLHIKGRVHLTNPHSQRLRQKWPRILLNRGGFDVGQGHVLEKEGAIWCLSHVS